MSLRVRLVLIVLSLLTIAALAIPLALSLADRRTATLAAERDQQLAALADAAAIPGIPLQLLVDRYHKVYGEGVLMVDADGRLLAARGLDESDPGVEFTSQRALLDTAPPRWPRLMPWHRGALLAATGVQNDGELIGAVIMAIDPTSAANDIAVGWLWVAVGCGVLLLLAGLAGVALTNWVLRPVADLERAVADMTQGLAGPPARLAGPPELRHFTSAFNAMAQAMRASLDRQRRLVADASHQLRNPLAALRLRADNLEDHVTDAGRPTYLSMTTELDRFETLLQQLLRLARAEEVSGSRRAGLSGEVPVTTDLGDVIQQRIGFWQPVADSRQQHLLQHCDPPGLATQMIRHEVEQLLDVAIDNALRYAGTGSTITVSATQSVDVELTVSDDGPGLSDADLPLAATRFWRGRGGDGTGLGLAIAAEIVAGHGGTLTAERAVEGGLQIRYRLPAQSDTPC